MPDKSLRLLALDGGGVRGLSSLMILQQLMETIDPDKPPKPCEYFDMIGGTSTGGLIAVMLGRLEMSIDDCITSYLTLSERIFQKKAHRVTIQGKIQSRFDSMTLEQAVKEALQTSGYEGDTLLKSSAEATCNVFVCATSKETGETVCLTSYPSPLGNRDLLNSTTIWEACRATSAASSFFDPIAIGPYGEEFLDGGTGANNPVWELWNQAQVVYGPRPLEDSLDCLVSIGTGVPSLNAFRDDVLHIHETLIAMATETEQTAERFRQNRAHLDDEGRYYRFNVSRGLEAIGLEEWKKKKEIASATRRYIKSQEVFKQMQACADRVSRKQYSPKYHIPFSLRGVPVIDKFADRPDEMAELAAALLPRRHSRQRRIFVLSGLGGMGKTQLAAQYARRHQDRYSAVIWLDGRSEDSVKQSIANAARRIPPGQIPEASRTYAAGAGTDINLVVEHVLEWLSRPDNDCWLVVLDNVDRQYRAANPEPGAYEFTQYLPGAEHGSILVTTRLGELERGKEHRNLQKVDDELARAIFRQWYPKNFDDDQAAPLLKLLYGLPLALIQAAAYMQQNRKTFAEYIRLYNDCWKELMESQEADGIPLFEYNRSIWTTSMVSFAAIRDKNEGAANLLLLWSLLDHKDLWYGLLEGIKAQPSISPSAVGSHLRDVCKNEVAFNGAIGLLLNYCLVERLNDVADYTVHPVVHQWAQHAQDEGQRRSLARIAVVTVGWAVPSNATQAFGIPQRRLLEHAERCSEWVRNDWIDNVPVPNEENTDESALEIDESRVLNAMDRLGGLYSDQGKLDRAEEMYSRALRGYEKALGPDHTSTIDTVSNLGALYRDQGKLDRAEEMYSRALRGYEKALGPDHTSTVDTVSNLGALYRDQGKLDRAEEMYSRALRGYEDALSLDHTSTLGTVNNLGNLYSDQGKLDRAEEMYSRALRGYENALGPDHTSTLDTVRNLGLLYRAQGKLDRAEKMYLRALRGYEDALGPDHMSTLNTVNNLGLLYCDQGKLDRAEEMYSRALRGYEKALGPDHTSTVDTVNNLGALYRDQGKLDRAEEMYSRALRGDEEALGPDHTSTVDTVSNLGALYRDLLAHTSRTTSGSSIFTARFEVLWDPDAFLREQQYPKEQEDPLGAVITLTGSASAAQALTCARYMQQTWPACGNDTLRALQSALTRVHHAACKLWDGTELEIALRPGKVDVHAAGTKMTVIHIVEQFAWLGAACRASPFADAMGYCTAQITGEKKSGSRFQIDFFVEEIPDDERQAEGSCWHPLFNNAVIVKGYPISKRPGRLNETLTQVEGALAVEPPFGPGGGLEIPLNVLAGLAQTQHVETFGGKLFIKGFSTMLVPTHYEGSIITWHLLYKKDGSRISYLEDKIPRAKNITMADIATSRHIVGWCSSVKVSAGADDASYTITRSRLPAPHPGCVLERVSIIAGKYITGSATFGIGIKDKPVRVPRSGYLSRLKWISQKFVVLWDEREKRGWLVNGTTALLHLLRASLKDNEKDKFRSKFLFRWDAVQEAATPHTSDSAIDVLTNDDNMKLEIYADRGEMYDEETRREDGPQGSGPETVSKMKSTFYRLQDRVDQLYHVVEKIIDHHVEVAGQDGVRLKGRVRKHLEGWDFVDVATERDPMYPRVTTLNALGKGWVDLVRSIQAITLLGCGFGDILQPTADAAMCHHWASLPKYQYYLAACVADIKEIMELNGNPDATPMRLSHSMIWHTPDKIFGSCQCEHGTEKNTKHSDFVQTVVPKSYSSILADTSLINLEGHDRGAVVFGHNQKFKWFWEDFGDPVQGQPPLAAPGSRR